MPMKSSPKSFKSANDEKVMANSQPASAPSKEGSRVVEPDMTTINNTKNSPIQAYYEFPSSNVEQKETYSSRQDAIVEKLGNKDSVKG